MTKYIICVKYVSMNGILLWDKITGHDHYADCLDTVESLKKREEYKNTVFKIFQRE